MDENYWLKREFYNKLSDLEKKLEFASNIRDKNKRLKKLLVIRQEIKRLLKEFNSKKIDNNFLFQNFIKKIKTLIFRVEKESVKK